MYVRPSVGYIGIGGSRQADSGTGKWSCVSRRGATMTCDSGSSHRDVETPLNIGCLTSINYLSSVTALWEGDCDEKERIRAPGSRRIAGDLQ